jgi:hypothetical protein
LRWISGNVRSGSAGFEGGNPLAVLVGEGLQRQHARAAVELVAVGAAEADLEADMRDAVCIRADRQNAGGLDHLVRMDLLEGRARTHVFQLLPTLEEKAAQRAARIIAKPTHDFLFFNRHCGLLLFVQSRFCQKHINKRLIKTP